MVQLQGNTKTRYIAALFDRIVPRYDLLNTIMSLGRDTVWRRLAVDLACPSPQGMALDIATGTGELALELARRAGAVAGVDLAPRMLAQAAVKARQRGVARRTTFLMGDALRLPFAPDSFDCATVAFGIRNASDMAQAFAEMRRVVRTSGRVVCLEIMPPRGLLAPLYRGYLNRFIPAVGEWLSGDREAYRYLADSVQGFSTAQELKQIMEEAGLSQVQFRLVNGGTIALHWGVKESR